MKMHEPPKNLPSVEELEAVRKLWFEEIGPEFFLGAGLSLDH